MVRTPVSTHAISIQPGLLLRRDISAETMKMPEPIMTPTTTIVASNRLRPRTKPRSCRGRVVGWVMWAEVIVAAARASTDLRAPRAHYGRGVRRRARVQEGVSRSAGLLEGGGEPICRDFVEVLLPNRTLIEEKVL